jgi:hypothetical protein
MESSWYAATGVNKSAADHGFTFEISGNLSMIVWRIRAM